MREDNYLPSLSIQMYKQDKLECDDQVFGLRLWLENNSLLWKGKYHWFFCLNSAALLMQMNNRFTCLFQCAFPGLFFFIFVFSIQLTVNVQYIFFANDWIRTTNLCNWKWLLYQLSHNHCSQFYLLSQMQTSQTGGQPYSDGTSPYGECSLLQWSTS